MFFIKVHKIIRQKIRLLPFAAKTARAYRGLIMIILLVLLLVTSSQARAAAQQDKTLNILFIGADQSELLMTALYNIAPGKKGFQSHAFFFPAKASFLMSPDKTLSAVFSKNDAAGLVNYLEDNLCINISYYIRIERQALQEAATFIEPIIVDGSILPLEQLFSMAAGPHDEEILGQLMRNFTRPSVYFYHLPRLVLSSKNLVRTDFKPTLDNLWLHFRIAANIDTANIKKTIVSAYPLPEWPGRVFLKAGDMSLEPGKQGNVFGTPTA